MKLGSKGRKETILLYRHKRVFIIAYVLESQWLSWNFFGWIGGVRFQQVCFVWIPWRISPSCGWQRGLELCESERRGSYVLVAILRWQPVQGPAPGYVAPGRPPFVMAHLVPGFSPKCHSSVTPALNRLALNDICPFIYLFIYFLVFRVDQEDLEVASEILRKLDLWTET